MRRERCMPPSASVIHFHKSATFGCLVKVAGDVTVLRHGSQQEEAVLWACNSHEDRKPFHMCQKCKTPPPPDTAEVARKKLLWKLAYAKESFNACKQIAEQYIADIKVDSHPYYYAFVSSACIAYARAFTHGEGVGQLPRRYFRFPDDALRATHDTLLRSRHQLYAHNDASVAMHKVEIFGTYDGTNVGYSYGIHVPQLRGIIFSNILKLCEFQMSRASEELAPMLTELWPPQTMVTILRAEHSNCTRFALKW